MKLNKITLIGLPLLAWVLAGCNDQHSNNSPTPPTNSSSAATPAPPRPQTPFNVESALQERREEQEKTAAQASVRHDFQFSDHQPESGINFEHHVTPDSGKYYKAVHYDHGNGAAVADIDGDGRLDIYLSTQLGANALYRNLGQGKFEDITASAGVGLGDRVSVAAGFADIDNDGDPDLFVTAVRSGNVLFENLGDGKFRDITEQAGLNYHGHSSGMVFFDFDKDGLLDLFLCNVGRYTTEERGEGGYYVGFKDGFYGHTKPERTEASILYRNLGNRQFEDVSGAMNLADTGWCGDATVCDVNEDGWPDLYALNMQGDDHYYENQAGKGFQERTGDYFPKTPWGCMGVRFFDFNQDGHLDLMLTDMHSDMTDAQTKTSKSSLGAEFEKAKSEKWCTMQFTEEYLQGASNNIFGNAFYLNRGEGKFEEVSGAIGAETFWPWGISVGDLNADGFEDVFVASGMGFGFRYGINSVLLNVEGKRFIDAEFLVGVEPRLNGRTEKTAFVLDCDGADKNHPLCRGRSGSTPVLETLSTRSGIVFDLDDDGDLDILTVEMNDRCQVLVSDLAQKHSIHYVKVQLTGTKSNRDGIGATVRVSAGGKTYTQYRDGKSGYFSHSPLPLYFGLGDAPTLESVEILWPSGIRQKLTVGIAIDGLVQVTEQTKG